MIFELGIETVLDTVVVVADTLERVRERVIERDPDRPADIAESRWRAQWPMQRKIGLADHVIVNDGSLEQLTLSAERLYIALTNSMHSNHNTDYCHD